MLTLNTPSDAATDRVTGALTDARVDDQRLYELLARVTENPTSVEPLAALRDSLALPEEIRAAGAFERLALLRAMRLSVTRLQTYPVDRAVKRLYDEELRLVESPTTAALARFDLSKNVFVALAKIATLRRFPAGQMTWEVSGIPRSWLPKVPIGSLPRVARYLLKLGGLSPAFVPHLNATRKDRAALLERETNRSWYRMAQSMKLQPQIRGLVASSWLHSPDTMRVSPHMTGFSRALLDHGALLIRHHPADLDCGVFYRSPERKKLYDEGQFVPTHGLVIWPRREMLSWADAHPEFADSTL